MTTLYTKKLTMIWNNPPPIEMMSIREEKINQMINDNKTDGIFEEIVDLPESQGVHGGSRFFVDQAAAEEFRTWLVEERAKYGHTPVSIEITDL